jgi:DNA-binding CsgD family transcriptional regulator
VRGTALVPTGSAPWPLTGRHSELDALRSALTGRRARSVVLVGPAGAGKTRLAREAQGVAQGAGRVTQWVTATHSSVRTPLGAFAPLLPATDATTAGSTTDSLQDLLRRSARALISRGQGRPFVLFVDDAHLLDEASAGLLQQLVATDRMLVVLTVRSGEPVPEALTALWKDDLAVRVEVPRLDNDAVGQLLAAALGGQVDPAAVADLTARSGGNVLFLRELVLGAVADGSLARDMDVWRLCGTLAPSERIVELVAARLHGLDDQAIALLQLAAYAEPLGTRELRSATPATVEMLERAGLLASELDGRRLQVRLVHPLYADVVRRTTSALRLAAMGRTLADAAQGGGRRRDDPLRIGIWRMDGGGGGTPEILLRAAQTARWHYDFALAQRLAQAAVDAGAGFGARLLAAQSVALQGRPAQAAEQMVELRHRAATDAERAQLAIAHIDCLWSYLGRPADGLRVAEAAEPEIADPQLKAEVASRRTGLLLIREGPGPAALAALPMLREADPRTASWLHLVAAYGLGRLGRLTEAQDAADRGWTAAMQGEPGAWYPWFYLFTRCENLAHSGAFAQAREVARAQYEQGLTDGCSEARAYFLWNLARPVRECGHATAAAAQAREAITLLRRLGRVGFEHSLLSTLAISLALSGDYREANLALVAADALQVEQPQWSATDHLAAQAWTAVAEGRLAAARTKLLEAAAAGERIGDLVGAIAALHDVARLGAPREVAERVNDLAAGVEGDLAPARRDHVQALRAGDPERLAEVSGRFAGMSAHLLAAEAAADAAVAWRRAGHTGRSDSELHRAGTLAGACPGARTPALSPIESREQLTGAERETALLAAAGRTNRQIAEELHLSVRTVDNRLQRVYGKLGISRRSELGALIR